VDQAKFLRFFAKSSEEKPSLVLEAKPVDLGYAKKL
jgi:hypothetical protein